MSIAETILESACRLPPFPMVMQRAVQLLENPETSAQDVVDVIQYDPSITANVLKLCNSALFGLPRTIYSIRDAVVLLGFNQVLEIVLSHASLRFFSVPLRGYGLEVGELWHHSVASALLPKIVGKRLNRETKAIHFTAALLHDVGKIVMSPYLYEHLEEIQRAMTANLSFPEAEKLVLGIDHAEVGSWLSEQWAFPKIIVSAIQYHHTPFLAPDDHEFVQMIYLCDWVATLSEKRKKEDGFSLLPFLDVVRPYGLREKDIEAFFGHLERVFDLIQKMVGIH